MRLLKKYQFKRMLHHCSHQVGHWIIVDSRPNQISHTRLGLTVTRRFGDAHERNRFKRLVREAFRQCYSQIRSGFDLNVKPRPSSKNAKTPDIIKDLLQCLNKTQTSSLQA